MTIVMLGIDLGKHVCSLAGLDEAGRMVMSKRLKRSGVIPFVASLPPCAFAMEACSGGHFPARRPIDHGHDVHLIAPQYVKPFIKRQKNDGRDAAAIAEAAMRPTMRFVSVKTQAQLDLQSLHRVRERLVDRRTALINQLRGILPLGTVIILAGLNSIPQDVEEQALIDRAGYFRRLFQVTLPMMMPIFGIAVLFTFVFTFTDMVVVYILTRGGPANSTHVLTTLAFFTGVQGGSLGQGAAVALFMFPVLAALSAIILMLIRRQEV